MTREYTPNPKGGPNIIRNIEVEKIKVPDLRITSQVDDHVMDEMRESIKKDGIKQPLQVTKIGEEYIVVDGLHRMIIAKELGMEKVPCIVHEGTEKELMIDNLVLNRQRGKSNPVQEAQIVNYLMTKENMAPNQVADLCSLSIGWVSRLYEVSNLPKEVLDLVESGQLGISAADLLTKLPEPQMQIQAARDAVTWRYTVDQVSIRVKELLNVRQEPQPGQTVFQEDGKPTVLPLTCDYCHADVSRGEGYIWICDKCRELHNAFHNAYMSHEPAPAAPPTPTVSFKNVLTDKGWEQIPS